MNRILAFFLLGVLCSPLNAQSQRIACDGFDVLFDEGFEADARQMSAAVEYAIGRLNEAFPDWKVVKLIRSSHLQAYVHAKPDGRANDAKTSIHTQWKGGDYFAELHVLAPSQVPATARTAAGQPKDKRHFEWLMIHELSSIVIDRVTHDKPGGWRIYSGPNWFVQGLENYLACSLSGANDTLNYYIQSARSDPTELDTNFGIYVKRDYVGGAAILAFMARDGLTPVRRILLSSEPTFGLAMKEEFGRGVDDFGTKLRIWLSSGPPAPTKTQ